MKRFFAALILASLIPSLSFAVYAADQAQFEPENIGRQYDRISIHPNGEDWLFGECVKDGCYILKFNIRTKQLYRYAMPEGYQYGLPSFSPRGNWIVAQRMPLHKTPEEFKAALLKNEIVLMRVDGTDFQVTAIPEGQIVVPIVSPDESKIAYWRSAVQSSSGRFPAIDFDVYEYDVKSKSDTMFAGPYNFVAASTLQYISNEKMLCGAAFPKEMFQKNIAYGAFRNSKSYVLTRGDTALPDPSFYKLVDDASIPSLDKYKNFYFVGSNAFKNDPNSFGLSWIRLTSSGEMSHWGYPKTPDGWLLFRQIITSPNGDYAAFIYVAKGAKPNDGKNAMGMLDYKTGEWISMTIPSIDASIAIPVSASH